MSLWCPFALLWVSDTTIRPLRTMSAVDLWHHRVSWRGKSKIIQSDRVSKPEKWEGLNGQETLQLRALKLQTPIKGLIKGTFPLSSFTLQSSTLFCAKRDKHYPSWPGQTSLATAGTNFTKPGAQNKVDPCTESLTLHQFALILPVAPPSSHNWF